MNTLKRIYFIFLIPICIINIVFGILIVSIPYWIFTGKYYLDSIYFNRIMDYTAKQLN